MRAAPTTSTPLRAVVTSLALGLLLMAVFTAWWASTAFLGWAPPVASVVAAAALAAVAAFTVRAVRLLRLAHELPAALDPEDEARRRRTAAAFGILVGVEGAAIGAAAGVVDVTGSDHYLLPVIALVVGLHFYPMGRIFQRTLDVPLATGTTLVAAAGVVAVALDPGAWRLVWSCVGVGTATATATYGGYMLRFSRGWGRSSPAAVESAAP